LARDSRADHKNIRLAESDVARLLVQENHLIVVVNRDGQFLLRAVLPNDVAIQELLDLRRASKPLRRHRRLFALLVFQNGLANTHAFIADVGAGIVRRRTDQLLDLLLRFMAKGAAQRLVWVEFLHWCEGLVSAGLRRSLYPIVGRLFSWAKRKVARPLTFWNRWAFH